MNAPQYRFGGLVTKLCLTLCVACQVPLSMGFPSQEYWDGLPFPSPEDLPNPGIKSKYPALAGGFFTTESLWKSIFLKENAFQPKSTYKQIWITIHL